MAFVFTLEFEAPYRYIRDFIDALAKERGVAVSVVQSEGAVTVTADDNTPGLAEFFEALAQVLPASLYMRGSSHKSVEGPAPALRQEKSERLPRTLGLCPRCMKEMFDPASRRYYYPFTHCNCCGAQHPFAERYPFTRQNSVMRFLVPCEECLQESVRNPFREDAPLISCHDCGVPVRLEAGGKSKIANDAGSFKKLFETVAGAIADGKRVLVKSLMGWRLFYDGARHGAKGAVLLLTDAVSLPETLAVIGEETRALMSLERPLLWAAVADERTQNAFGRVSAVKYPDEGFTILLAKELKARGMAYVAYEEVEEDCEADMRVSFDLPLRFQKECRLFINKSVRFFVEGERVVFPLRLPGRYDRVAVVGDLAAVPDEKGVLIDAMERFEEAEARALYVPENETPPLEHSVTVAFDTASASVLSVLAEHGLKGQSAVGVYFDEEPAFVYYNGTKPIVAVPPTPFDGQALKERIAGLREGSDRLVENFQTRYPAIAERLFGGEVGNIFEAAAVIMELAGGFEAVGVEAMAFGGKGGVQVDTRLKDNRFDPYAFVASLLSYKLAGMERTLMAYSVFESFGDYVTDVATTLKAKAKAEHLVLCGRAFGHPSLFSRVQKKMGHQPFLMNRLLPVGRENTLLGALAL
ncbi:MAG: hypothetical protein GXO33_06860 [Epsilonproteobacteria bacterium]|nr:hypothetical protein [Campylobacterota bacterium]